MPNLATLQREYEQLRNTSHPNTRAAYWRWRRAGGMPRGLAEALQHRREAVARGAAAVRALASYTVVVPKGTVW